KERKIIMKKYSLLIAGTMILLFTFYFTGFGSAHKEVETLNSTFIQVEEGDLYARQSPLLEDMTLDKRIEQSEVIVSGTVAEILPATETMDLVIPLMEDFRKKGYNFLHTDIVIKVDEFIGNSSYEYDEIVVRRNGGRLDNFVHIYDMENYEVGEKVLIFG